MQPVQVEIIQIVGDKTRPDQQPERRWFQCSIKNSPDQLWIPVEKLPSYDLITNYVQRLITSTEKPTHLYVHVYELLAEHEKDELDSLAKEFLTIRGLELPLSNKAVILASLRLITKESSVDEETLRSIRRSILIEKVIERRKAVLMNLKKTEMEMNVISDSRKPIKIVNDVDLEEFPSYLRYVNKYIPGPGLTIVEVPLACDCENAGDCCLAGCSHFEEVHSGRKTHHTSKGTDDTQSKAFVPYDENGRLLHKFRFPIYECNVACKCDETCQRRVVQKGADVALEIFRTFNGTGWGVRTLEMIPKGTFVSKYAGEIIFWEQGFKRECQEYLFDIDYNVDRKKGEHSLYTVDAFKYGNVSRFINHSCNSNLSIHVVFINNIHPQMAEIVFFAHRDIYANEELTINYVNLVKKNNDGVCRCAEH